MTELQAVLNRCLRKTVAFDYVGKNYTANLNLTMDYVNSLKCENESFIEEDFYKVEKYLRDEGFFD
jgi:hypothetical protein